MIVPIKTCPHCGSEELVSNGHDVKNGKGKYHCKSCDKYGTLDAAPRYSEQRKAEILKAYFERASMCGIARTFGVARQTLAGWLSEEGDKHPDLEPALRDVADQEDVPEYDELQHFVKKKPKAVALDRPKPKDTQDHCLLHWRPQHGKLQEALAADS
jgi:transposase-like protein